MSKKLQKAQLNEANNNAVDKIKNLIVLELG